MTKQYRLKTTLHQRGSGKSVLKQIATLEQEIKRLKEITKFFRNVSKKIFS